MMENLKKLEYEEISEILQDYLDQGETGKALQYCEAVVQAGNPYGYMFMGFIYEEGHGLVEADYKKALHCYEKADVFGMDMKDEIARIREKLKKAEAYFRKNNNDA